MQPTSNQSVPSFVPAKSGDKQPATPAQRPAPAPLPLDADLLRHVGGGAGPTGTW